MATHIYDDFVLNLHKHFKRKLENISAEFNFDLGPEFEIAICELLREFLPNKYGICRGFVVAANGDSAGDDIVIYDRERFPTLRFEVGRSYERKEKIPIEAVYAYIEAKHTLTEEAFLTAVAQVEKVKKLCSQREPVSIYQVDPHIGAPAIKSPVPHLPDQRNPTYVMILSRYSVGVDGKTRSVVPGEVNSFLESMLKKMTMNDYLPDLIVAGEHNYMSPAGVVNGENKPSLYYIHGRTVSYQLIDRDNLAFGAGLSQLAGAMEWIRLGRMPWERIVNDTRFPEKNAT